MNNFYVFTNYTDKSLKDVIQNKLKKLNYSVIDLNSFDSVEQSLYSFEKDLIQKENSFLVHIIPSLTDLLVPSLNEIDSYLLELQKITLRYESILSITKDYVGVKYIFIPNFSLPHLFEIHGLESSQLVILYESIHKENLRLKSLVTNFPKVQIVDMFKLGQFYGTSNLYSYKFNLISRNPYKELFFNLLAETVFYFLHEKVQLVKMKCLAVDLDNTLWGGVIGEDGISGIELGTGYPGQCFLNFQRYLLYLRSRGVILVLISKNNIEDALTGFSHPQMIMKIEDFAAIRVNWNRKSVNLVEIANELSIGLESIVFFDDSAVERQEVSMELPSVTVFDVPADPYYFIYKLNESKFFGSLDITREDNIRSNSYNEMKIRKNHEITFRNKREFLLSLEMKANFEIVTENNLSRALQLINKTNQFNLNPVRMDEKSFLDRNERIEHYLFSLSDKFGDYGRVGIVGFNRMAENSEAEIDLFAISCRAINRELEYYMLDFIVSQFNTNNAILLKFNWQRTVKNLPALAFIEEFGNLKLNPKEIQVTYDVRRKIKDKYKDLFSQ